MGFLSDFAGAITGSTAASAASRGGRRLAGAITEAGDVRAEGGREAFDFFREQLSPFATAFGGDDIAGLNALATDPQAQMDFLTNNPLFEALKNQARESTFRTQSGKGALGSSATDEILQNAFLTRGNELINNQINRQLPLYQGAQSATTNLATGGASALSGIKEALAAAIEDSMQAKVTGSIGAANAKSQGIGNILGLGAAAFGGLGGVGGITKAGGIGNVIKGLF